jgi:uncharacterized protein (DUF1330 family)
MMAERGIALAHTTILCWVQQYVPDFEKRYEAVRLAGGRFLARGKNVTSRLRGQWVYLYRAVDRQPAKKLVAPETWAAVLAAWNLQSPSPDKSIPLYSTRRRWL